MTFDELKLYLNQNRYKALTKPPPTKLDLYNPCQQMDLVHQKFLKYNEALPLHKNAFLKLQTHLKHIF